MKKLLLVLCTALCLPFISCSNDDALDNEALTRSETIESQYEKTIQYYVDLLKANGSNADNKFEKDLLYGTWECVNETAEIYIDGEKGGCFNCLYGSRFGRSNTRS